jgi:hypothetical protein
MQQASLHTGGATAVEIASSSQKLSSTKMRGKMISGVVQQIHKAKFLLNDHSTTILSAVGVAGTVGTAVLTGRASFKAADVIALQDGESQADLEAIFAAGGYGCHDGHVYRLRAQDLLEEDRSAGSSDGHLGESIPGVQGESRREARSASGSEDS